MKAEYLEALRSRHSDRRGKAWSELLQQPEVSRGLTRQDLAELYQVLSAETDDDVGRKGHLALTVAIGWSQGDPTRPQEATDKIKFKTKVKSAAEQRRAKTSIGARQEEPMQTVNDFIFRRFRMRSAVLGVTEKEYRRRDEDAMLHMMRCFPVREYGLLTVEKDVSPGDDSWFQDLVKYRYEAIMITGRLWMFGPKAVECLSDDELRFHFPIQHRPEHLKKGEIDREFHCIQERDRGAVAHSYHTEDQGKIRTDYGFVQVYPVYNGRHWMNVVVCAGCSHEGTFGAAWWLTYEVQHPHGTQPSSPIPLPPVYEPNSRMEALIRIKADKTKPVLKPLQLELCRLYLGDYRWTPQDSQWHRVREPVIVVHVERDRPLSMSIDSRQARLVPNSQNFLLAACLALEVQSSKDGWVSVASLANNRMIWDGKTMPTRKVKQRLNNLSHHALKNLIQVQRDAVRLAAEVVVVSV